MPGLTTIFVVPYPPPREWCSYTLKYKPLVYF